MRMKIVFLLLVCSFAVSYSQETGAESPPPQETPAEVTQPAPEPAPKPPADVRPPAPRPEAPQATPAVRVAAPQGEEALLRAINANPTDRTAYDRLLRYYRAQNRVQDHLRTVIRAIQNTGGSLEYYLLMGDDYMTLGDYSKAVISYQYALRESPVNPIVYLSLGIAHLRQNHYYSAETAFLAALHYGEASGRINAVQVYRLLGECYEGVKNYTEALRWYQRAYRQTPTPEHRAMIDRVQSQIANR